MKRLLLPLAVASLSFVPAAAHAASEDEQIWLTSSASVDLGNGFKLSEELTARFGNAKDGLYEIENNLLLGYKINDMVTVWAGYTHDPGYVAGHNTSMEHRAREQVTFDNVAKIGSGKLSFRLRTEQRWRDGATGTGWRVRPYAKYSFPLGKGSKTSLSISHESFINLNTTSFQGTDGYDRMRNAVAVKFPLLKGVSGEVGYLNQYGFVRSGTDKMDHVATASLGLSF